MTTTQQDSSTSCFDRAGLVISAEDWRQLEGGRKEKGAYKRPTRKARHKQKMERESRNHVVEKPSRDHRAPSYSARDHERATSHSGYSPESRYRQPSPRRGKHSTLTQTKDKASFRQEKPRNDSDRRDEPRQATTQAPIDRTAIVSPTPKRKLETRSGT